MVAMEKTTSGNTAVVEPHLLKEIGSKFMSRSHPTKRPIVQAVGRRKALYTYELALNLYM